MTRIFISHSSSNNAEAVALRDWLEGQGWNDQIFLDLDPKRGIAAGERWERALNEAANRCEAVLFLVSKVWLASRWCLKEFNLAQRLNKRLFGLLIEDLSVEELPADLAGTWQIVRLASGRDHIMLRAVLPITQDEVHVTFSNEGLGRLKRGLEEAGLDPKYFAWPPASDPNRAPYRGLRPLEAEDAGIFFGREGSIVEMLDRLRGLRAGLPPRLLAILGASGSGKSSFLRAGLLPRLARDERNFLPLPVIRPQHAAISGETGLVAALAGAFAAAGIPKPLAELRKAVEGGTAQLRLVMQALAAKATPPPLEDDVTPQSPALILSVDQAEELFLAEAQHEAKPLLALMRDLLTRDEPAVIAVFTIRTDSYERLQVAPELDNLHQEMLNLSPVHRGSYGEVIKGPARRLEGTKRALSVEDSLVDQLLSDIETGGAKDVLPLLAFTLERLYLEYGAGGALKLLHYHELGRVKGSIEAAVERAFKAADADPSIPRDRQARLNLLRRGLIPWLVGIDPETGVSRRRIARLSEIPREARPLIDCLVEQRLLSTDVTQSGEAIVEPAHETLLRQWGLLQGWLVEDAGLLGVLEGVKRGSRDWAANAEDAGWLSHSTTRLSEAERLNRRPDIAALLEPTDLRYLAACRARESAAGTQRRRIQAVVGMLCALAFAGLAYATWSNLALLKIHAAVLTERLWPKTLSAAALQALAPTTTFHECAGCPEMVVVPAGSFMMGAPDDEARAHDPGNRSGTGDLANKAYADERPRHQVTIARPFAASRTEVTFEQWDTCVLLGGCPPQNSDEGWGRGTQPVIHISWEQAKLYTNWLAKRTGKPYRLLSEAEWEYAARAGSDTAFTSGNEIRGKANCDGCGSQWDNDRAAPVGKFSPNAFGLHDMHGNVWEWVEDCYQSSYDAAPVDGTAAIESNCVKHVLRGGSFYNWPINLRSAARNWLGSDLSRDKDKGQALTKTVGFRVARTLSQ